MKIKWLGHACFLMTTSDGVRIVTDPFNDEIGYKTPSASADIVTVSHGHGDHNYVEAIPGGYKLIKEPGKLQYKGVAISGVPTFHDDVGGAQRGGNIIFTFEADGLTVCHCGDLGHLLSKEQSSEIGRVDVLMIPVGGFYTIDAGSAVEVVKQLDPQIVIPMHYRSPYLKGHIATVLSNAEPFVAASGMTPVYMDELSVDAKSIAQNRGLVLLNY